MELRIIKIYIRGDKTFPYELDEISKEDHSEDEETYGIAYLNKEGKNILVMTSTDGQALQKIQKNLEIWREEWT